MTDNVAVIQSLDKVLDYLWKDEMYDFENMYEVEIQSQDDLKPWIEWAEGAEAQWNGLSTASPMNHIFYHLMILKQNYGEI